MNESERKIQPYNFEGLDLSLIDSLAVLFDERELEKIKGWYRERYNKQVKKKLESPLESSKRLAISLKYAGLMSLNDKYNNLREEFKKRKHKKSGNKRATALNKILSDADKAERFIRNNPDVTNILKRELLEVDQFMQEEFHPLMNEFGLEVGRAIGTVATRGIDVTRQVSSKISYHTASAILEGISKVIDRKNTSK